MGQQDGQTTRAGAQIERASDFQGIDEPRCEILAQQLGDVGSRHDHALVHVEPEIAEPGLVGQVGGGRALPDAAFKQLPYPVALVFRQRGIEVGFEFVRWQVQCMKREIDRFIECVSGAMPENQSRRPESLCAGVHEIAHGLQGRRRARPALS